MALLCHRQGLPCPTRPQRVEARS